MSTATLKHDHHKASDHKVPTLKRTDEDRAANPNSTTLTDEHHLIGEPAHDPIVLGSAAVLFLAGQELRVWHRLTADHLRVRRDGNVHDCAAHRGIEVLTGKRLQRPEPPDVLETVTHPTVQAQKDAEALASKAVKK